MKKSQRKLEQEIVQQKTATQPAATPEKPSRVAISRHRRKCSICRHPLRDHIEEEFLEWRSCKNIVRNYQIDESALYRHAHALGLFPRRAHTVRFALSHIMEQAANVEVTAHSIISAVRAFAHITDDGRWIEHPKHVIVERRPSDLPSVSPNAPTPPVDLSTSHAQI